MFLRRQHHNELTAFHFRELLDSPVLHEVRLYALQQLHAQFLMRHLTTAKPQRHLRLVALLEKLYKVPHLDVVIADLGTRSKLDLFQLSLSLLRFTHLRLLLLLKQVFAEIHNPAHRRIGIWRYLNQVELLPLGQVYRSISLHDAGLFPLGIDDPNLGRLNLLIPSNPFFPCDSSILQINMTAARGLGVQATGKLVYRHAAKVITGSRAHGHGIRFRLPIAYDQEVRDAL